MSCSFNKKCKCFECILPKKVKVAINSCDRKTLIPLIKDLHIEEYEAEKLALLLFEARWPLHDIIYFNNSKIPNFMMKHGSCIDSFIGITQSSTALHIAVRNSDIECVKLLLEQGANPNITDRHGDSPLGTLSTSKESLEILDLLLQYGATPEILPGSKVFQSRLFFIDSDKIFIQKLLEYKVNLMAQDHCGNTPLHHMAKRSEASFIDLLETLNLNVNIQNKCGETPLHWAVMLKSFEYIKFLLNKGADVNIKNQLGEIPLVQATRDTTCQEINELLLDYGTVLDDESQIMVLKRAIPRHELETIKPILARIALIHTQDTSITEISRQLIRENANVESYFNHCNREIQCTRIVRISENCQVTYFNILQDKESQLQIYVRNDELINSFDEIHLVFKFPIYAKTIKKRFRKAVDRQNLIQKAVDVLGKSMQQLNCNSNIIENIAKLLGDDDLKLLIV